MLWQFRRELIKALVGKGEVVISMPFVGHEKDFMKMGCKCINTKIERRGMNPAHDLKLVSFYRELLKSENPDVVITYSIKPNVYCGILCRTMKIPYFVNVQGLGTAFQSIKTSAIASAMYKASCKDAIKVFFENKGNADLFCKNRIVNPEQVVINPGAGVNLTHFSYKDYPSEKDGIRLLYIGRIMKEKGVGELLDAYSVIRKKYQNVSLEITGFFEDEYEEEFKAKIKENSVIFNGFSRDPRPYYENCHCVILPSYHEGMSNVLLEAAATGRPIIVSNIYGCREAINHETNGLLFREKDTEDLISCLEFFLDKPEEEHRVMGLLGRKRAEEVFDKEKVIERVMKEISVVC